MPVRSRASSAASTPARQWLAVMWSPKPARDPAGSPPAGARIEPIPERDQNAPMSYAARAASGPVLAVAGDVAVDEPRVLGRERRVVEPEPRERVAPVVGDEDVRAEHERARRLARGGLGEVERDRALAAVVEVEARAGRQLDPRERAVELPHRVAARRLDLHHVRAPVGHEPRRRRSRDPEPHLHHAHALKQHAR